MQAVGLILNLILRPVLAHLTALEAWVSVSGARDDRREELELVARAVESVYDRVASARLAIKSSEAAAPIAEKQRIATEGGCGAASRRKTTGSGISLVVNNRMYNLASGEHQVVGDANNE